MTIDAFIADPNKIGTCFATMRKKKSEAVKYIMAWTDCGVSEAVSLIHSFEESSDYANYLGTVSRAEADMLRAEIERRRAEERLRIQSQSRPEPVVEQRKVERKLNKPIKKSHERRDGYGFEYIVHVQNKCQKMNTPISEADIVERLSYSFIDDDKSAVCLTRRAENGICNKEFDS